MPTPRSRQAARLRARRRRAQQRARWLVILSVVGVLGLVVLLLTAFGSGGTRVERDATAAVTMDVLAGDTQPEPQVLATLGNLRLQQPIAQESVTAIGFHGSRDGALELDPTGRQANEGLLLRLWRRIAGTPEDVIVWYQLAGTTGPGTRVLDVGAAPGTDVYAPVDGTVAAISNFVIDCRTLGARIDIRPLQAPSVFVSLVHLRPDPALAVGSSVQAATSRIGPVVDVAAVERQSLAAHARDRGNNVALAVYPAAGVLP
jgi:hypothetical protein